MSTVIGLTFEKPKKEKEPKPAEKAKAAEEATKEASGEGGGK